jgi:hypothetical protein
VGARFSAPVQTGPGVQPDSCIMGTGSFSGIESGRGMTLTTHSLLVSWSRKGRAIPLLPLMDVRPVQSLSACTRVHFTLSFTYIEDAMTVTVRIHVTLRRNHCCRAEVVATTYSVCVSVALVAQCVCAVLSCHLWPIRLFHMLSHYLKKRHDFREKVIEHKTCFDFLYNLCLKHFSF